MSRKDGFSVVLALGENECIGIEKLEGMVRSIRIIKTITNITSKHPSASYVNGFKQIDVVWVSRDLAISAASLCPHHFAVGHNLVIMVSFYKNILIVSNYLPEASTLMHRLMSSNSRAAQLYLLERKTKIDHHKIVTKIKQNSFHLGILFSATISV